MLDANGALPRSIRFACAYNGWVAGAGSLDDARDAVVGDDAAHDVLGVADEPVPVLLAFGILRGRGAVVAVPALPVPGDLTGLGGPPSFNADAVEAGEAVLLPDAGIALVPAVVGEGVTWQVEDAVPAPFGPDLSDAELLLRAAVRECADRLDEQAPFRPVDYPQPASPAPLPPGFGARAQRVAALALQCLAIAELARHDDGGAVSAYEVSQRHEALGLLARSARHALVAASVPVDVRRS